MNKPELFEQLLKKIDKLTRSPLPVIEALFAICDMLKTMVPAYDWVGFYLVDRENKRELVLGPYVGVPTEHDRIPFGKGVCGQAAERKETIVIQDVSKEDNYLSCSMDVQSEIVVPIFKDGELIGEIDIDSHEAASFSEDDTEFLKSAAEMVARVL